MKNIYINFVVLLVNKPYIKLALNIVLVIIIQTLWITIAYTEIDLTLHEHATLPRGEKAYRTTMDQIVIMNQYGEIVNQYDTIIEYYIDRDKSDTSTIESNTDRSESDSNDSAVENHDEEIVNIVKYVMTQATTKSELVTQLLEAVEKHVPPDIWARDIKEVQDQTSKLNQYIDNINPTFGEMNILTKQCIRAAIITSNIVSLISEEFNTQLKESLLINLIFESRTILLESNFSWIADIGDDSDGEQAALYLSKMQELFPENIEVKDV